jgi:protein-S-isoprenylcysteine O-methyltransferase Ste14
MFDIAFWIICALLLLWVITFLLLSWDVFKTGAVKIHKTKFRAKESFWVMIVVYTLVLGAIIGEYINLGGSAPRYYNYIGVGLFFLGGLLRVYARKALDRFFTFDVIIQKGHKLVTKGVYRFMRHPGYLGMLFMLVGLALALSSLYGGLAILIFYIPALLYRISAEEDLLIKAFGQEYLNYMQKTKKLIPFIY